MYASIPSNSLMILLSSYFLISFILFFTILIMQLYLLLNILCSFAIHEKPETKM